MGMFHSEFLPICLVEHLLGLGTDVGQEGLVHNLHSSPPKSVQWIWGQGSVWTRSSHVSMDLICALGHSDAGIEKGLLQTDPTKLEAYHCPKYLDLQKH